MNLLVAPLRLAAHGVVALGDLTIRGVTYGVRLTRMVFTRSSGLSRYLLPRTRFDYASEVDPLANSIVVACMGWICRNFPDAPVKITRRNRDGLIEDVPPSDTGPGRMLQLLERPNPYHSGVLMWYAVVGDFLLGNAYIFKQRDALGRVESLWWIYNRLVEPRWDPSDPSTYIGWYDVRADGGIWLVPPGDMIHLRQGIDPLNPRKGRSQLASLFREIFTDDEAANMTASLMRNLGVPGVVIAPSNTSERVIPNPDEVSAKFQSKFGDDRRGGVMTFSTPTDIKILSWSPQQMDLKALRRVPEERVSAVTGVPAGVAGLGAGLDRNTYSNYGEARVAAYTEGVLPLQRLIAAELEVQLLPEWGNEGLLAGWTYDVIFDWTAALAMREAKDALWDRAKSAATVGLIMRSDFKRLVNLPVAKDGSDDVWIYPQNYLVVPAGAAAGARTAPAPKRPGPTDLPALPASPPSGNGRHPAIGVAT